MGICPVHKDSFIMYCIHQRKLCFWQPSRKAVKAVVSPITSGREGMTAQKESHNQSREIKTTGGARESRKPYAAISNHLSFHFSRGKQSLQKTEILEQEERVKEESPSLYLQM